MQRGAAGGIATCRSPHACYSLCADEDVVRCQVADAQVGRRRCLEGTHQCIGANGAVRIDPHFGAAAVLYQGDAGGAGGRSDTERVKQAIEVDIVLAAAAGAEVLQQIAGIQLAGVVSPVHALQHVDRIFALAAVDNVISKEAGQIIVAGTAIDRVVARAGIDLVLAAVAPDDIVGEVARAVDITRAEEDQILERVVGAEVEVDRRLNRIEAVAFHLDDRCRSGRRRRRYHCRRRR